MTELIEEINNNKISYYYFKNDKDLFKRIKETTFTIAKEIMLKKVENSQLPKTLVRKICVKYDYEKAIDIIKIIETMKKISMYFDWIDSTLFDSFIEPIQMYRDSEKSIFINSKIDDLLDDMLSIYEKFEVHCLDYTSIPQSHRIIKVPVLGEVIISNCSVCKEPKMSREEYKNIIHNFLKKYEEFRQYVGNMKLLTSQVQICV